MACEKDIIERGYVLYSDFGAVGDGKTDDYAAVFASHEFANLNSLPVLADEGKTYYFHVFDRTVEIKTDTDFGNAKFIIDDRGDEVYDVRDVSLFTVQRDELPVIYTREGVAEFFPDASLKKGDLNAPFLAGHLAVRSLVRVFDEDHRDFVRFGSNVNSGTPRSDVLLVDTDGSIDPSTPVAFDFDKITRIEIFRADDKPITVRGGNFETICCTVVSQTDHENRWRGYYRQFRIFRCNTVMRDMNHVVSGEPDIPNEGYGRSEDGKLRQSYPYYGFLYFYNTVNSSAKNCNLCAHTTYYEDKKTSEKPVPQGTYDLVIEYSSHVTIEGITNGRDISDKRYWGLMSSNGAKNLTFRGCSMSRFDAHRGFWNADLIDCEFGQTINVIGGGRLYLENVTRTTGSYFIALRGDYGATFDGEIIMKNCRHLGGASYRGVKTEKKIEGAVHIINSGFGSNNEKYLDWDFGYTCYLPRRLTVEGYEAYRPEMTYVFNGLEDSAFTKGGYVITESVTYIGTQPFKNCEREDCMLAAVPVIEK